MDERLIRLENSNIGCHIGSKYFGGIGYADDLDLLCPTAYGLQTMLKICESFGQVHITHRKQFACLYPTGEKLFNQIVLFRGRLSSGCLK